MNTLFMLGFFSGCTGGDCEGKACSDTGPVSPLPASCDSASPDPDPLKLDWRVPEVDPSLDDPMIELLDVEVVPDLNRAYAVGQGGLIVYSLDPPKQVGVYPPEGQERFDHVENLGNGLVAVSSRQFGLEIVDTTTTPYSQVKRAYIEGAHGMAHLPDRLLVLDVRGALVVLDLADPTGLSEVAILDTLGAPWDIVIDGDWAYVADNKLGLVPIDLSQPDSPEVGVPIPTTGGAQDVTVSDGHAYVATGANGIEVFSLASPGTPEQVGILDYSTAIVSVSANDQLLWGVGHEDLVVLDITTPENPVALAIEPTPQYGMHVTGIGNRAWVADWNLLDQFSVDRDQLSPAADPSPGELFLSTSGSREITLRNRGAAPLLVTGAEVDENLEIAIDRLTIPAGESASIKVTPLVDIDTIESTLCLATNDPNEPQLLIQVGSSKPVGAFVSVGEEAPDFILEDLDGNTLQLSAQLGHPVVLAYFATW